MRSFADNAARKQFAPPAPDYVDALVLVANTPQTYNLPAGAKYVVFSNTAGNFYVNWGGPGPAAKTAAVPGSAIADGTGSEANPEAREIPTVVQTLGTISIIADAATVLTMSWYLGG